MTLSQIIRSPRIRRVAVVVTLLYIVTITLLSLVRLSLNLNDEDLFPHFDKVVHFCFYLGLNFLMLITARLLSKRQHPTLYTIFAITLFSIFYSYIIEFLQPYFGREMEMLDGVANTAGAITGAVLYLLFRSRLNQGRRPLC